LALGLFFGLLRQLLHYLGTGGLLRAAGSEVNRRGDPGGWVMSGPGSGSAPGSGPGSKMSFCHAADATSSLAPPFPHTVSVLIIMFIKLPHADEHKVESGPATDFHFHAEHKKFSFLVRIPRRHNLVAWLSELLRVLQMIPAPIPQSNLHIFVSVHGLGCATHTVHTPHNCIQWGLLGPVDKSISRAMPHRCTPTIPFE